MNQDLQNPELWDDDEDDEDFIPNGKFTPSKYNKYPQRNALKIQIILGHIQRITLS